MRFMAFPFDQGIGSIWPIYLPYFSPFGAITIARIAAAGQLRVRATGAVFA
jgi:hypothetical protein